VNGVAAGVKDAEKNGSQPRRGAANEAPGAGAQVVLEWRSWLAADTPGKAVGAALTILVGSVLITLATASAFLGLAALALLTLTTREFFLPMRYRITDAGAWAEGFLSSSFIAWKEVRACHHLEDGLKLSPFAKSSRLEPFRGVYLRFAGNREEVAQTVRRLAEGAGE